MLLLTMEERHAGDVLLVVHTKAERRLATEANMMLMVAPTDVTLSKVAKRRFRCSCGAILLAGVI